MKQGEVCKSIRKIQRAHCAYDMYPSKLAGNTPSQCDCKFGTTNPMPIMAGEAGNGCPELRVAHAILEALTPFEWARVLKRLKKKS